MKGRALRAVVLVLGVVSLLAACASTESAGTPTTDDAVRNPEPPVPDADAARKEAMDEERTEVVGSPTPAITGAAETRGGRALEPGDLPMVEEPLALPGGEASRARGSGEPGRVAATTTVRPQAQASGLSAGFADDNKQFNYFVQFLDRYGPTVRHETIETQERIVIRVADEADKPLANAEVTIWSGQTRLLRAATYADGTVLFFPRVHRSADRYRITATAEGRTVETEVEREGRRSVDLRIPWQRRLAERVDLDVVFVLDTTGSMGEEIERLKLTIELINLNLTAVSTHPRVRFGLVLYRDQGDDYVTRVVQPTDDLEAFQAELALVEAGGGGDTPEDLQAALRDAVNAITWNQDGIRLAFVITDAAPHLDYGDPYTYVQAVRDAQTRAIKIHSVGTGGLELDGELVLRQISQYTYGKYIFLTYGERGESSGGAPGSVSHHTGANFQTDKLESIIIRLAREELAYQSDTPLESDEEYFEAVRITDEERSETLGKLFEMAIQQLVDYSSVRLAASTLAAAVPLVATDAGMGPQAEYLSEQLVLSLSRSHSFQVVERQDLQKILEEMELQVSGLVDDATAARVGDLLGAEILVTGRVFAKPERYELFLKLLRVSTGEVLSVTKALVDRELGI